MTKKTKTPACLLACFYIMVCSYGQEKAQVQYYNAFDKALGLENTAVYQGVMYKAQSITDRINNEFFQNLDFENGSIDYDGHPHYNLDLKYDVFNDRVLLKIADRLGGGTVILFNDLLQGFHLAGSRFKRLDSIVAPELEVEGFYEVSNEGPYFTLFTKHRKLRVKQFDRNLVYYKYSDRPSTYILFYKDEYHDLNTKKEVKKLFPGLKSQIDKFYSTARGLRKNDPNSFRRALLSRVENGLSEIKSEKKR